MTPGIDATCRTADEAATDALGRRLGAVLRGGDVLGLEGPLGAGKTRLVRGIAAGLGVDPRAVSSPSFVLVQEYETAEDLVLAHVDAWRLEGADAVEALGWDELVGAPDVVVIVEWPSRIADAMPAGAAWLEIGPAPESAESAESTGSASPAGPGDAGDGRAARSPDPGASAPRLIRLRPAAGDAAGGVRGARGEDLRRRVEEVLRAGSG